MKNNMLDLLQKFREKHILVIGDIMLDKYIFGETTRISQEAPVKIIDVTKESYAPGGAANAANNIVSLNANVLLIGVAGNDEAQKMLIKELKKRNIGTEFIIEDEKRQTTQKIRVMDKDGQLIRIDYEIRDNISKKIEDKIIEYVQNKIADVDGILISDYAKGVITKNLIEKIKEKKSNKLMVIDPKQNNKDFYKNVDLITPNNKEACAIAEIEETNEDEKIKTIGTKLVNELNTNILITRGEKGMSLFEKDGNITNIPTVAKEVIDVSGAGDTVSSIAALALAAGATLKQAAIVANHAAGIVVGKLGTATLTIDEIKKSLENEYQKLRQREYRKRKKQSHNN